MSSSSDEFCSDIENGAREAASAIIPVKSKEVYMLAYEKFVDWCTINKTDSVREKVLTSYFNDKSKTLQSSTMWSLYSKLKAVIFLKRNVDISKYSGLIAFLKRHHIGHIAKKSDILTRQDFDRFMIDAEDTHHLLNKVAFIIGIGGACRKIELLNLRTEHVVDNGEYLAFSIPDTKNYMPREFFVTPGNVNGMDLLGILHKYISLRPAKTPHNRFFVGYRSGKCTIQPVGTNTFAAMPRKIATFLGLNNVERFTGHCFRRSSATILAEGGAGLITIKQAGGWKSGRIAEGYIQNTKASKRKIANRIFGSRNEADPSEKTVKVNNGPSEVPISKDADATESLADDNYSTMQCTSQAQNQEYVFEGEMATVHTITSSQITKQSVALPNTVAQLNPAGASIALPTAIPGPQNGVTSAGISGSTFHGCNFYFGPRH